MKKIKMRKVLSFCLTLAMVISMFSLCCVSSSAVKLNEGIDALRAGWSRGKGPLVNDWDIDYSYYSPVENGADPEGKYPLVIFMAGALEGQYEGKELEANEVARLTSEEYQSRFKNGGAFILIPRAPEEDSLYWDQSKLVPSLMAAIKDFVDTHPQVDKTQIINEGWCLGGTGAINLAAYEPEYFAGTVIMCPSRSLTATEAKKLANNNVWFISCIMDSYSNFYNCNLRSWFLMKLYSNNKSGIRLTTYSDAPDTELVPGVPFIENHNVWDNVSDDMELTDQLYKGHKTIDGNCKTVEDNGMISWINTLSNEKAGGIEAKANFVAEIFEKIFFFFHESFKADARLKIFDTLTVIYKAMGWI